MADRPRQQMDLGLIRRGDALQASRQLGALPEAQLLIPCLFGALSKLPPEDRQRSNEKTPGKPAFWCKVRWKQWQVEVALRHGGWLSE